MNETHNEHVQNPKGMKKYIVSQFGNPRGGLGGLVGKLMARKNRERIDWAVSTIDIQRDDHVLEIGFGPGVAIQRIAGMATKGFIAGIDHSEVMVEQASKRNAKAIQEGRVDLGHGSVEALSYGNEAFDKVFAINSMMFWPKPVENLKELRRVLKPGGLIAIIRQPRWAKTEEMVHEEGKEIVAQLSAAGFRQIRQEFKPMQPVTSICTLGIK
jgi:ubiquinone/menaquinone biosynthesis C-methylase UbiE